LYSSFAVVVVGFFLFAQDLQEKNLSKTYLHAEMEKLCWITVYNAYTSLFVWIAASQFLVFSSSLKTYKYIF
jgi:hypothetical protein